MGIDEKQKSPKEIDVFNRFSHFNKLKIFAIALGIAIVLSVALYFFAKTLYTYTVTYETNGGTVFGEELESDSYKFLQKTQSPKNLKKEGYYIEGFYTDENFTNRYEFGKSIWKSMTLYVKWEEGVAVQLFFAEGEERISSDGKTQSFDEDYLKLYFEQYVKAGSEYTLPDVYNNIEKDKHYGEQLLWYDSPECIGHPVENETYIVEENIKLYGKWFETDPNKYQVSEDGTLLRYLGNCDKLILPSKVLKIKDIETNKFSSAVWNESNTVDGSVFSAFDKILADLKIVYVNAECVELGSCSFRSAGSLTNVYFNGNKLLKIGDWAFGECKNLKEIDIPMSVRSIGRSVFTNCGTGRDENGQKIRFKVTGGSSVEEIGSFAFNGSSLEEIVLENVKFVGGGVFAACFKLKTITIKSLQVVESNDQSDVYLDDILLDTDFCEIYVRENLLSSYKNTFPWSQYNTRIFAINNA